MGERKIVELKAGGVVKLVTAATRLLEEATTYLSSLSIKNVAHLRLMEDPQLMRLEKEVRSKRLRKESRELDDWFKQAGPAKNPGPVQANNAPSNQKVEPAKESLKEGTKPVERGLNHHREKKLTHHMKIPQFPNLDTLVKNEEGKEPPK